MESEFSPGGMSYRPLALSQYKNLSRNMNPQTAAVLSKFQNAGSPRDDLSSPPGRIVFCFLSTMILKRSHLFRKLKRIRIVVVPYSRVTIVLLSAMENCSLLMYDSASGTEGRTRC